MGNKTRFPCRRRVSSSPNYLESECTTLLTSFISALNATQMRPSLVSILCTVVQRFVRLTRRVMPSPQLMDVLQPLCIMAPATSFTSMLLLPLLVLVRSLKPPHAVPISLSLTIAMLVSAITTATATATAMPTPTPPTSHPHQAILACALMYPHQIIILLTTIVILQARITL